MNDLEFSIFKSALEKEAHFLSFEAPTHECKVFADKVLKYFDMDRKMTIKALEKSYTEATVRNQIVMGIVDNFATYPAETPFVDTTEGGDSEKN